MTNCQETLWQWINNLYFVRVVRLRILQIILSDADATGNRDIARAAAYEEVKLRAEIYPL